MGRKASMIPKSYCEYCGKPIYKWSKKGKGIPKKYCSDDCYKDARGRRVFAYTICNYCGKTFKETRDRPNLFCSAKCSANNTKNLIALEKRELNDQDELINKHYLSLYNEYKEIMEQAEAIRHRMKYDKQCKICGNIFTAKSKTQICCSDKCSKINENKNKDNRLSKNGKPDLSITLTKLYMRDGGVCKICGRNIDFDCNPNDNYYPSIDHIKPIAKGGLHSWDNVQLACRICNSLKRDNWL